MALSSSLTTLFVLIMGVAIVGGLADAHCCVNDREKLAVIGRVLRDSAGCDFAHSAPGARSRCTLGECG